MDSRVPHPCAFCKSGIPRTQGPSFLRNPKSTKPILCRKRGSEFEGLETRSVIKAGCVDGKPGLESSVRGIAVYLDTFAIKSLAKGDASLRQRFIAALCDGADLLFSIANALEISGAQGASSQAVRALLDELGPNWYPIEMVPQMVMQREAAGLPPSKCCVADELLRAFFRNRTCEDLPGSGRVIDLSEGFFRLGAFVDWLAPRRDEHLRQCRELDRVLIDKIPFSARSIKRIRVGLTAQCLKCNSIQPGRLRLLS